MMRKTIVDHYEAMDKVAEFLIPYTFPVVPFEEEQKVMTLKQRVLCVDGYHLVVCYSKADYEKYLLKTLQIQSIYTPFLPFHLVCKVGRLFLGSRHLSYVEFFRGTRKVYCWTVKVNEGRPISPGKKTKAGSYEGFNYRILSPGSVDLQ